MYQLLPKNVSTSPHKAFLKHILNIISHQNSKQKPAGITLKQYLKFMKKCISILCLLGVFIFNSCEREIEEQSITIKKDFTPKRTQVNERNSTSTHARLSEESVQSPTIDTGDDEPRPDKQHWRVKKDTIQ